eukprot:364485-Chlamydomonas_euryale.AAC.5
MYLPPPHTYAHTSTTLSHTPHPDVPSGRLRRRLADRKICGDRLVQRRHGQLRLVLVHIDAAGSSAGSGIGGWGGICADVLQGRSGEPKGGGRAVGGGLQVGGRLAWQQEWGANVRSGEQASKSLSDHARVGDAFLGTRLGRKRPGSPDRWSLLPCGGRVWVRAHGHQSHGQLHAALSHSPVQQQHACRHAGAHEW